CGLYWGGRPVCSTPAIWNGKCYVGGAMGMYCLSAKDGSLLWQGKQEPSHKSPLVADGVVFHADRAYNAETGQLLWTNKLWSSPQRGSLGWELCDSPMLWTAGGTNYVITTDGS